MYAQQGPQLSRGAREGWWRGVAVFRAAAEALSLQARHGDGSLAVGRHQDLQLRSAPPTSADDSAADAAPQRN